MLTGAALATINRIPVSLLASDIFATRAPNVPVSQVSDLDCTKTAYAEYPAAKTNQRAYL